MSTLSGVAPRALRRGRPRDRDPRCPPQRTWGRLQGAARRGRRWPMSAIVAYLRVSSKAQDAKSQRHAIERAAAARGDTIGRWLSEKRSAKTLDRPVLDQLRDEARQGMIAKLYTFKL